MKTLLLITMLLIAGAASAQQYPLFSQYMMNKLALNPAMAGSEDQWEAKLLVRRQWLGMEDAPFTQTLSAHGKLKNSPVGIGAILINDITGPTRRTGLEMSYAYHIPLAESHLSLGLSGSISQFKLNGHELIMTEEGDRAVTDRGESIYVPDAGFGVYWYNKKAFVSFSMPYLFKSTLAFTDYDRALIGHISRHYLVYGGYKFDISDDFKIEPSVLLKAVEAAPAELDINTTFYFMDRFWTGFSYRTNAALVFLAGMEINEQLHFGYSFDLTTTDIKSYDRGSHELMVGYRFEF